MIIFPSLDILNGKAVKLVGGKKGSGKVIGDPLKVAKGWEDIGAEWIHIVDLDAAFGEGNNKEIISEVIKKARIRTQVGGGIRDEAGIEYFLSRGAKRVVVGTKGISDIEWLKKVAGTFKKIILAVDAEGETIVTKGWTEKTIFTTTEFAKAVDSIPISELLYTNVSREGRLKGVNWGPINSLLKATSKPVIFSGGVTTTAEIKHFQKLGAYGIIIGSAFYDGRLDFEEIMDSLK